MAPFGRGAVLARQDPSVDDDAAPDAGPQRGAEDDVGPAAVEVGRRRRRAVDRLGEDEALGVVRQPHRAPQRRLEVLVERPVVEAEQVRVPDRAAARLQEPGGADPDRGAPGRQARARRAPAPARRSPPARRRTRSASRSAGARARRPSSPSRSPSILVPPTSMPIRTAQDGTASPGFANAPVRRLRPPRGRGQNRGLLRSLRLAFLAVLPAGAGRAGARRGARPDLHDPAVCLPARLLPAG